MRRIIAGPDRRKMRPISTVFRSTETIAPITPRYTGKNTPTAIRATFEASKIPSQRMNSGTHAIEGIARKACSVGSAIARASAE
jgi:hypothetical protein